MKTRFTVFTYATLLTLLFAAAGIWGQSPTSKTFSDTATKPKAATISLDAAEAKAVEDWETSGQQLARQLDAALAEMLAAPVDCTASMQAHAKLKDIGSKRALLTEQLKTMKQTHRLAHNCPTCEYQDTKTMVPAAPAQK